jgi:hypothetical protein
MPATKPLITFVASVTTGVFVGGPPPGPHSTKPRHRLAAPKRFKWSSFSHHNQFQLTQIDGLQLEAANRPVPCKHKGIRQFSDIFGTTRVKATTLQGVANSNMVGSNHAIVAGKQVHGQGPPDQAFGVTFCPASKTAKRVRREHVLGKLSETLGGHEIAR